MLGLAQCIVGTAGVLHGMNAIAHPREGLPMVDIMMGTLILSCATGWLLHTLSTWRDHVE